MRIGAFMFRYLTAMSAPHPVFFGQVGNRIGGLLNMVLGVS